MRCRQVVDDVTMRPSPVPEDYGVTHHWCSATARSSGVRCPQVVDDVTMRPGPYPKIMA